MEELKIINYPGSGAGSTPASTTAEEKYTSYTGLHKFLTEHNRAELLESFTAEVDRDKSRTVTPFTVIADGEVVEEMERMEKWNAMTRFQKTGQTVRILGVLILCLVLTSEGLDLVCIGVNDWYDGEGKDEDNLARIVCGIAALILFGPYSPVLGYFVGCFSPKSTESRPIPIGEVERRLSESTVDILDSDESGLGWHASEDCFFLMEERIKELGQHYRKVESLIVNNASDTELRRLKANVLELFSVHGQLVMDSVRTDAVNKKASSLPASTTEEDQQYASYVGLHKFLTEHNKSDLLESFTAEVNKDKSRTVTPFVVIADGEVVDDMEYIEKWNGISGFQKTGRTIGGLGLIGICGICTLVSAGLVKVGADDWHDEGGIDRNVENLVCIVCGIALFILMGPYPLAVSYFLGDSSPKLQEPRPIPIGVVEGRLIKSRLKILESDESRLGRRALEDCFSLMEERIKELGQHYRKVESLIVNNASGTELRQLKVNALELYSVHGQLAMDSTLKDAASKKKD